MKRIVFTGVFILVSLGCARVRVEAPKEPIKLDITMRLDVYQHVEKDINAIEDIVSGAPKAAKLSEKHSFKIDFVRQAYADDGLSPEVESAALRRKERLGELSAWESKGVIGENSLGLVEIRDQNSSSSAMKKITKEENSDRKIIYAALAKKNNVSLEDIQKAYAKKLQGNAPGGTPIEVVSSSSGGAEWVIK